MAKLSIDNALIAEDFFADARLLGLQCPLPEYKFVWHVNQALGLSFRYQPYMEVELSKQKRSFYFPVYQYDEPNINMVHYIYANRHDGEYLLPELKHLDFVWLMKGEMLDAETMHEFLSSLKNLEAVQLVTELTNEKIKHKQHLVL